LLVRISSHEIAEWQAYERAFGPIGSAYGDDVLAAIHEQLQTVCFLLGAQMEENPMPVPQRVKRPMQLYLVNDDDDDSVSQAEFDSQF
jgi:hypothetical protein